MDKKTIVIYLERPSELKFINALVHRLEKNFTIELIVKRKHIEFFKSQLNKKNKIKCYIFNFDLMLRLLFIKADYFITSTPGIGNFYFRKSIYSKVRYGYIFHSLIDINPSYPVGYFDNYDFIICTGRNHKQEIREREYQLSLVPKKIIKYGYEPISNLRKMKSEKKYNFIIAPTWNNSLVKNDYIIKIIKSLGGRLPGVVQLHELTPQKVKKKVYKFIEENFKNEIKIIHKNTTYYGYINSQILITDVSGSAFEYAYGLNKNVLFFEEKGADLVEVSNLTHQMKVRNKIGVIFSEKDFHDLSNLINYRSNISEFSKNEVYCIEEGLVELEKYLI